MATSFRRTSSNAQPDVNLYCAQCNAQIGIFENEWIRLTSSYARSKERGTHFGTDVGQRTQVVPSGPAQRSAEGCGMAEVFCRKCSNMVGQYCKSTPDAEKQPLLDQYFYKLSRTYLKDSSTNVRVEPVFGYGSDMLGPGSSRSSILPGSGMIPTSRWANTPLRQSSRTPAMSAPDAGWRQSRQSSQISSLAMEVPNSLYDQSSNGMQKMRQELKAQKSILDEQSSQSASHATLLDDHDALLRSQDARLTDQESCLDAQATRIVEQDALIQEQSRRLQTQQLQLTKITDQLTTLQNSMADLKNLLPGTAQTSQSQTLVNFGPDTSNDYIEAMIQKLRKAHRDAQELRALRNENTTMRSQLATYADKEGSGTNIETFGGSTSRDELPMESQESQVLGKRKRKGRGRPRALSVAKRIASEECMVSSLENVAKQMPTPRPSQSCSESPLQEPSVLRGRRKNTAQRKSTGGSSLQSLTDAEPVKNITEVLAPPTDHQSGDQNTVDQASDTTIRRTRSAPKRKTVLGLSSRETEHNSQNRVTVGTRHRNSDQSAGEAPELSSRRVTRAATKTLSNDNLEGPTLIEPAADSSQPDTGEPSAGQEDTLMDDTNLTNSAPETQLPTVQIASNVLGMDLGALIASSEALKSNWSSLQDSVSGVVEHSPSQDDAPDLQLNQANVGTSSHDHGGCETANQTEFIQDSAIYDNIDFSDDDDDLMQPNPTLYGEDSQIDGHNIPSESNKYAVSVSAHQRDLLNGNSERADRSMAPEPIKPQKKPIPVRKRPITLDRIHIATPQIFTEHILAGRVPKAIRPTTTQARERELNAELTQLGLAEWIGKNKYSKEYREAVTAARARFRNSKKAAYLQSKGLNMNLSDPSASLPEQTAEAAGSIGPKMPLSETENVPGPSVDTQPGHSNLPENLENEMTVPKAGVPATRARVRRSSVSLMHGLEDTSDQPATHKIKAAPEKRKSYGRRKSQQQPNSVVLSHDTQANADTIEHAKGYDTSTNNEQSMSAEFLTGLREAAMYEPTTVVDLACSNALTGGQAGVQYYNSSSSKTSIQASSSLTGGCTLDAKSLEQLREEAILLRDRMAKELMEREDMEV